MCREKPPALRQRVAPMWSYSPHGRTLPGHRRQIRISDYDLKDFACSVISIAGYQVSSQKGYVGSEASICVTQSSPNQKPWHIRGADDQPRSSKTGGRRAAQGPPAFKNSGRCRFPIRWPLEMVCKLSAPHISHTKNENGVIFSGMNLCLPLAEIEVQHELWRQSGSVDAGREFDIRDVLG